MIPLYSLSSFLFLMGMAFALPPNPGLHVALQKAINPNGITLVDKIPEIPGNSSELNIYYPNIPEDSSYYTLDNTTAKCNYEYTSTDTNNTNDDLNPIRFGNVAISSEPVEFLVECTVAKNAAGEDNYIFVKFSLNGTVFDAYGDARALFRKRDLDPIPLSDNSSYLFSDHAFNPNQFTTVLVACPPLDSDRPLLY